MKWQICLLPVHHILKVALPVWVANDRLTGQQRVTINCPTMTRCSTGLPWLMMRLTTKLNHEMAHMPATCLSHTESNFARLGSQ
jgi:hypothetical protein